MKRVKSPKWLAAWGTAALLSLVAACDCRAAATVAGQVAATVKLVQRRYRTTQSLKAKFEEEIRTTGGSVQRRSGIMYYVKPGHIRWQFDPPQQELIVSQGALLYDYQPDLNQVIRAPLKGVFSSAAPAAFLLGIGDLGRDYKASTVTDAPKDGLRYVTLSPKQGTGRIELGAEPMSGDVRWLRIRDAMGNETTFRFSAIEVNPKLDDALFRFQIPAGADVIEAPGAK